MALSLFSPLFFGRYASRRSAQGPHFGREPLGNAVSSGGRQT